MKKALIWGSRLQITLKDLNCFTQNKKQRAKRFIKKMNQPVPADGFTKDIGSETLSFPDPKIPISECDTFEFWIKLSSLLYSGIPPTS